MVSKFFTTKGFVAVVLVLFMVSVGVAYTQQIPNPGHGGNNILVSVDGYGMTLHEAINKGVLVDGASATKSYTQTLNSGHNAEHIFVSVDGVKKTLQQAISTSLCGSGSHSYSSEIIFGHSASDILVSVGGSEMSLQDAINGEEFCIVCVSHASFSCYDNDVYWYDSCGNREGKREECGNPGCVGGECMAMCTHVTGWRGNKAAYNCNTPVSEGGRGSGECPFVAARYYEVGQKSNCHAWCQSHPVSWVGTAVCQYWEGPVHGWPEGVSRCAIIGDDDLVAWPLVYSTQMVCS